jgi:hypothetical protein
LQTLFNIILQIIASTVRKEKEIKNILTGDKSQWLTPVIRRKRSGGSWFEASPGK